MRSYILRELNAYFFMEASSLGEETLAKLAALVQKKPALDLFIDTNFLFSILGLHENPSTEAANALIDVIDKLRKAVGVKLYVAPITVDEAKGVIAAMADDLRQLQLPPNLAEAAVQVGLTGIALKFAQESRRSPQAITAEDYFRPYLGDFVATVRARGMELSNRKLDGYATRQDVVDDVNEELEYQRRRPTIRPKGYAQLQHDMVLWHLVNDQRPSITESPLDARSWIVTIDFRLLAFDSRKRKSNQGMAVCVHPTTLIQVLQFWLPRSSDFEKAIVGSLRLPFLLRDFDSAAEKVTVRILQTLDRFENVGDLSEETVASVLLNEAVRQDLLRRATYGSKPK